MVERLHPAALLPDTHAHYQGENAQHVYGVAFDSTELWGPESEPFTLHIDLYETYLEEADEPRPPPNAPPRPADRAPGAILIERGLVDPAVLDKFISMYENDVGPLNGAKVVAKAWTDPEYRERLLADGTAAIAELGFKGPQGECIVVLENTPALHDLVVCTLCSCYPWPVLGLPPSWYKDPAYRVASRARSRVPLLAEFGLDARRRRRDPGLRLQLRGALSWSCPSGRRGAKACRRRSWPTWSHAMPWPASPRSRAVMTSSTWTSRARPPRLGSNGELVFAEPWQAGPSAWPWRSTTGGGSSPRRSARRLIAAVARAEPAHRRREVLLPLLARGPGQAQLG